MKILLLTISAAVIASLAVLWASGNGAPRIKPQARHATTNNAVVLQEPAVPVPVMEEIVRSAAESLQDAEQEPELMSSGETDRRSIAYDHPQMVANIRARQAALHYSMAVLRGEQEPLSSLPQTAYLAAQMAIMVRMDATARSEIIETRTKAMEPSSDQVHQLVSGNAYYRFEVGEFPEYDRIRSLLNKLGDDVPAEQIPIEEILASCEIAQSYTVE